MSSMGFYPVTHGRAVYFVGTPIFPEVKLRHGRGVLTVRANGVSRENRYIQSASLNGRPFTKNWLSHEELFGGDATLTFEMGARPNRDWGSSPGDLPQSMCDEALQNEFRNRRLCGGRSFREAPFGVFANRTWII